MDARPTGYEPLMSTTVIASRHGAALHLAPALSADLDVEAVRRVLADHGLRVADEAALTDANEFIAGQDLDPSDAGRLAADLRALGLTVRVVNRTGLTQSRRVSGATAVQSALAMVGVLAITAGVTGLTEGSAVVGALMLAAGLAASGVSVSGLLSLLRGGGSRLAIGAAAVQTPRLSDRLAQLTEDLPAHLAEPILQRARRLEVLAKVDPTGPAALELQRLTADLDVDQTAAEGRELRDEVARARRALQEMRGG